MTATPIDQVLADGNCGEATNRGEEARVQTCGATNRNRIQGRYGQVSVPCNTKPFSSSRAGKCGARARKVHVLIRGDLSDVPVSRACPKGGAVHARATRCWAEVSRRHSTRSDTPLGRGRPKPNEQGDVQRPRVTSPRGVHRKVTILTRRHVASYPWVPNIVRRGLNTQRESPSADPHASTTAQWLILAELG